MIVAFGSSASVSDLITQLSRFGFTASAENRRVVCRFPRLSIFLGALSLALTGQFRSILGRIACRLITASGRGENSTGVVSETPLRTGKAFPMIGPDKLTGADDLLASPSHNATGPCLATHAWQRTSQGQAVCRREPDRPAVSGRLCAYSNSACSARISARGGADQHRRRTDRRRPHGLGFRSRRGRVDDARHPGL